MKYKYNIFDNTQWVYYTTGVPFLTVPFEIFVKKDRDKKALKTL